MNAFLNAGVVGSFWCLRHGGPDRVQVNISHAGKEGFFGIQSLGFESTLPEMPRALIFPVGLPRNWLIQAFHKPAQVRQPLPEGFRVLLHSPKLCSTQLVAPMISLH